MLGAATSAEARGILFITDMGLDSMSALLPRGLPGGPDLRAPSRIRRAQDALSRQSPSRRYVKSCSVVFRIAALESRKIVITSNRECKEIYSKVLYTSWIIPFERPLAPRDLLRNAARPPLRRPHKS